MNTFSGSASDIFTPEEISQVTKILLPHAHYYSRKDLFKNASNHLIDVKFLWKQVTTDKDYLAADALIFLKDRNSQVASYLETQNDFEKYKDKALNLGKKIVEESSAIDTSISQVLSIINKFDNGKLKKLSNWLEKPLPCDRIKCFTVELLLSKTEIIEKDEILNIFSEHEFCKAQVEKAKAKISSNTIR